MFLRNDYPLPFSDVFTVKVGGVSGADEIFTHPKGNGVRLLENHRHRRNAAHVL